MKVLIPVIALIVIAALLIPQTLFAVDEAEFAIVTRFGEIQEVYMEPGLKVKAPFVDAVHFRQQRLLRVDIDTATMPDREAQFLDIDAYVRYRITDPVQFFIRLRDELGATARITNIVIAALRAEIGGSSREEIIGGRISVGPDGLPDVDPLLVNGVPSREAITRAVLQRAATAAQREELGIEIMDVRMMRADFPAGTIEESVFERMRTERQIQAQRLRAEGEEEFLTRTADVDRRVEIIRAEAQETRDRLRGDGQAEAIGILAEALERDPDLFSFLRSLEAYQHILNDNTTVVLPPQSPLFRFLQDPAGGVPPFPAAGPPEEPVAGAAGEEEGEP